MKILLSLLLSLFVGPSLAVESATSLFENTAATGHYVLSAEQWARPRSGQALLAMPPVRAAVQQLLNTSGGQLLIRYPGGDEGSIWAEELQNWLISLGIEPTLIEMRPGSIPAQIELQIMTTASVKE